MGDQLFVPADFAVPGGLTAREFRLEPLGSQHNAADYAAWTANIGHIRATPGFPWGDWPHEMSLAENLRGLERHAQDFAGRRGFTYTVLSTATARSSAASTSTRRPARTRAAAARADGMRSSVPGCARTARRSTRCCTARSAHGWNATGRSTRLIRATGLTRYRCRAGAPTAGNSGVTRRLSAYHRTTSDLRNIIGQPGGSSTSLIRNDALMFVKGVDDVSMVAVLGLQGWCSNRVIAGWDKTGRAARDGACKLLLGHVQQVRDEAGDGRRIVRRPAGSRQPNIGSGRPRSFGR